MTTSTPKPPLRETTIRVGATKFFLGFVLVTTIATAVLLSTWHLVLGTAAVITFSVIMSVVILFAAICSHVASSDAQHDDGDWHA